MKLTNYGKLTIFIGVLFALSVSLYSGNNADSILRQIDKMLSLDGVIYSIDMKIVRNKAVSNYKINLWAQNEAYVGVVKEPAADRGTVFLNQSGYTWAYYPEIEKRIKYSAKQKMLGSDFSFSDVAGVRLLSDYSISAEQKLNIAKLTIGLEPDVKAALSSTEILQIDCTAVSGKRVNYPLIRIYVGVIRGTNVPLAMEYYTISEKKIGTIEYMDFKDMGRGIRPLRLKAVSAFGVGNYSEMYYRNFKYDQQIPDIYFTEVYMNKMSKK